MHTDSADVKANSAATRGPGDHTRLQLWPNAAANLASAPLAQCGCSCGNSGGERQVLRHRPTGTRDDNLLRKQNRKEASRSGRACRPTGWSSVKMMKSASGKLGPCSCMTCAAAGARVLTWDSFAVVPPASLWPPQACPALACHELACKGCCTETPTAAQAIRAAVQPLKAGKAADKSAHLIEYQLDVVLPGLVAPLLADNVPFAAHDLKHSRSRLQGWYLFGAGPPFGVSKASGA